MKGIDNFLEWYRQRFNTIIEQVPNEVWNNISKELDINDVWTKVDSKLNSIDRRKTLVRRSAYVSLLLLLFLMLGSVILKTFNTGPGSTLTDKTQNLSSNSNLRSEIPLADKKENHFSGEIVSTSDNETNRQGKEFKQPFNNQGKKSALKSSPENSQAISFSNSRKTVTAKGQKKIFIEPENSISESNSIINPGVIASHQTSPEELLTFPIPMLLVSNTSGDSIIPDLPEFALAHDPNFYSQSPSGNNPFHGFYSGGTFSFDNIWLLNQITLEGLKAKSLNQTKIEFGNSYGISAGYNFNTHFGGEANWYINSQSGQTYNIYDEGQYVTEHIRMDISVINLLFKYRKQAYNTRLNIPKSQNLLLGVNVCMLKRNRSSSPLDDNDDDIDIYDNMDIYYEHPSYGLVVGYEYEVLAFHKLLLSSALIGNCGLNNIFVGNEYIPVSFNRTYAASLGINFSAKYLIK
jgi:hypothetical protein